MIQSKKVIVVAAILLNSQGQILLAQRGDHQHQAGKWEFPGGKVESNERPLQALSRELKEELGIDIKSDDCQLYQQINHTYPDKQVQIDFFLVKNFINTPQGMEGQPLVWVTCDKLTNYPLPKANQPVMEALLKDWPQ